MEQGAAPAPRERGWLRLAVALAAFVFLPMLAPLSSVLPVGHTLLLLAPALAVCFILGWRSGGRLLPALVAVGLAVFTLAQPATAWEAMNASLLEQPAAVPVSGYLDFARAWALLLAGSFGLLRLVDATGWGGWAGGGVKGEGAAPRPFIARALPAVGLSILLALVLVVLGQSTPRHAGQIYGRYFAGRTAQSVAAFEIIAAAAPADAAWVYERVTNGLRGVSLVAQQLYPALLALEGLAALALGWALYHRLGRARLGPPLAPLKMFRFNDQLIWGFVAGITLLIVPSLGELSLIGLNLLMFFGALYVLRGLGIMAWFVGRTNRLVQASAVIAGIFFLAFTLVLALILGVNDTWFDLRGRGPTSSSPSRSILL